MIQASTSHQQSSFSRIPKERWYRLSQEEKGSLDRLSEAPKAAILVDKESPHKTSNNLTFMMLPLVNS